MKKKIGFIQIFGEIKYLNVLGYWFLKLCNNRDCLVNTNYKNKICKRMKYKNVYYVHLFYLNSV